MPTPDLPQIARSAISAQLAALKAGRHRIRVPGAAQTNRASGMSDALRVHMYPEMFVQLSGVTDFAFPPRHWRLLPGEVCVMPAGVPHGERVKPWRGQPFQNLVFMFVGPILYFHLAYEFENPRGYPGVQIAHSFEGAQVLRMAEYLKDAADACHSEARHRNDVFLGLMQAHFGVLLTVLGRAWSPYSEELFKIALVRQFVTTCLGDKDLCVKQLAEKVGCTPSYLSYLFHKETGKTLHAFITEQRIIKAMNLLKDTALSIRHVAEAVGYRDPAHFARLFRQVTGKTARAYRSGVLHLRPEFFPYRKPV